MANTDSLNALRDIHMPLPVSSWPPSLFLIGIVLLLLMGFIILGGYIVRYYRQYRFQRGILRELSVYEQAFGAGECTAKTAGDISSLLKQVAYVYFSRETIAGLYGEAWYLFLKKTAKQSCDDSLQIYFTQIPYQKDKQADLAPLLIFAKTWISHQFKSKGGVRCLK